jgi:hypothetical protein
MTSDAPKLTAQSAAEKKAEELMAKLGITSGPPKAGRSGSVVLKKSTRWVPEKGKETIRARTNSVVNQSAKSQRARLGSVGNLPSERKKHLFGVLKNAAGKVGKTALAGSSFVADLRANYNVDDEDSSDSSDSEEEGLSEADTREIKQERKEARAHTTAAALMRRESIKYNPEVHVVIGEMWAAVDFNREGEINKEAYANFIYLLGKVVTLFWDEEMDELEYDEAESEAEHDFHGKVHTHYTHSL